MKAMSKSEYFNYLRAEELRIIDMITLIRELQEYYGKIAVLAGIVLTISFGIYYFNGLNRFYVAWFDFAILSSIEGTYALINRITSGILILYVLLLLLYSIKQKNKYLIQYCILYSTFLVISFIS